MKKRNSHKNFFPFKILVISLILLTYSLIYLENIVKIDKFCKVDLRSKNVVLKGYFALDNPNQPLEYLACAPGSKDYESLLALYSKPSNIHLALLTIGLEPKGFITRKRKGVILYFPNPKASKVKIFVIWQVKGKIKKRKVESLIWNKRRNSTFLELAKKGVYTKMYWLFTGSRMVKKYDVHTGKFANKKVYAADVTGTIIGLQYDVNSVLSLPFFIGDKWENIEAFINPKQVPKAKTKVKVVIMPLKLK
ncbi:MAG: YdjY domain-containing protein [Planctomycetota bacterium]